MQAKDAKPRWYVIFCTSGQENKVADLIKVRAENTGISEYFEEVIVPTQEKIAIKKGKKVTVKEKIYPGYLLIKMVLNDSTWPLVRDTQGVSNFAGTDNKPTPITDTELQAIVEYSQQKESSYKINITEGDVVSVTSGVYKDFTGSVVEVDRDKGKVKVMLRFLGREVPVELDVTNIVKQ